MTGSDDLPVVIGSSMSGLMVSLSLSSAGIDHVLIGGPEPAAVPRLGESLNEAASPELWRRYGGKYPECFRIKSHISLMNGKVATMAHIADPNRCMSRLKKYVASSPSEKRMSMARWYFASLSGRWLLHVDRITLDRALYHEAIANPHCRFVQKHVTDVTFDRQSDRVEKISLSDGNSLEQPRFVFDTMGFRSFVASAADVVTKPISNEQYVVFNHYTCDDETLLPKLWWRFGTNLLRPTEDVDGIEGISSLICTGRTVSLIVSLDADRFGDVPVADVLDRLRAAYQRRGIDYRRWFPGERTEQSIRHRYYMRDRGYGANWMLCGGTFANFWFPSSAGLWTNIVASELAPRMIREPQRYGQYYEAAIRDLMPFHRHLEKMIFGKPFEREADAYDFWSRWFAGVPGRFGQYLEIAYDRLNSIGPICHNLRQTTKAFRWSPRLLLLTWGCWFFRCTRQPELSLQADAFPDYFRTSRFRISNVGFAIGHGFARLVEKWGSRTLERETGAEAVSQATTQVEQERQLVTASLPANMNQPNACASNTGTDRNTSQKYRSAT